MLKCCAMSMASRVFFCILTCFFINVVICQDDGDEKEDFYDNDTEPACRADEFECSPGMCIPEVKKCDGRNDCPDGRDERLPECGCRPHEFECSHGFCIEGNKRCDGVADCPNGEDETEELCGCRSHEFECPEDRSCILQRQVCDRRDDCPRGSDERDCYTRIEMYVGTQIVGHKITIFANTTGITVSCHVRDSERRELQPFWFIGTPRPQGFEKIPSEISKLDGIEVIHITLHHNASLNGKVLGCMPTCPADDSACKKVHRTVSLDVPHEASFDGYHCKSTFDLNHKASYSIRFTANPGPTKDEQVQLMIEGKDAIVSGTSSADGTIKVSRAERLEYQKDLYEVIVEFPHLTLEQTQMKYKLNVTVPGQESSVQPMRIEASKSIGSRIGVLIGIPASLILALFVLTFVVDKKPAVFRYCRCREKNGGV